MHRTSTLLTCSLVVLLVGTAGADLDKKQAGLLSRTDTQLTNFDTQLDRFVSNPAMYSERIDGEMKRRIEKQEEALKTLPADDAGVAKALAPLAAVKAKHAQVKGKLTEEKEAKADEKEEITKLVTAPEFAADLKTVENFVEMFTTPNRYKHDHYLFARWPGHEMVEEMVGWGQGWSETQKKQAALVAKYDKVAEYRGRLDGEVQQSQTAMTIALRNAKERFPAFESAVTAFTKESPAQIEKEAAALAAATKTAVEKQDFGAFTLWESALSQHRNRVQNIARIWAPLASPEERARIEARVKAIAADTDAAAEKLTEVIVRENRAPADKYGKGDRAELEKFVRGVWAKHFPAESILAVRFPSEAFERQTSWQYRAELKGFAKVDRSSMRAWVIVKDGAKRANLWPTTIYRMHLKGDSLELNWADRSSKGPPPTQRMLMANFK